MYRVGLDSDNDDISCYWRVEMDLNLNVHHHYPDPPLRTTINVTHTKFDATTTSITRPIRPSLKPPRDLQICLSAAASLADSDTTAMSLNTPVLNSDSVSPLVLGEPMDGGEGSSLGWVAVLCLSLSQVFAWA
ncbi:hypothetical protein JHK85_008363 [Glycine max]|nr:hypothetical protein JHK85_008363 [Glycine max]